MTTALGLLSRRALARTILTLALPVVTANVSQTLMGLLDTLMVGQLGAASLAAVGVATLIFSAVASTLKALDVPVQTFTAHRVGAGRDDEVGEVLGTAGAVTILLGAVVTALGLWRPETWMGAVAQDAEVHRLGGEYLRWRVLGAIPFMLTFQLRADYDGIGWTRVGKIVGVGMNVVNVLLNWVLIFGNLGAPALGVKGAAIASAVSSLLAVVAFLVLMMRPSVRHRFRFLSLGNWRPALLRPMFRMAWPAGVQVLGALLAVLVFFVILGRISTVAVAAGNVVFRIAALSFMPGIGVGVAVQTLVGQSLGGGDPRGAVRAGWGGVVLAVLLMGAFSVVFLLTPGWLMGLFATEQKLIDAGTPILRMMGLVQIFDAVGLTLAGALKGAGATRIVMLTDVLTAWLLFLPCAWFFGIHLELGLNGAWIGVLIWFFVYAVGITWWYMRGDWQRNACGSALEAR